MCSGLDRIEKKFGGERFDEQKHPENAAKNKALNESSEFSAGANRGGMKY